MEQIKWVKLADLIDNEFVVLDIFPAKWQRWNEETSKMETLKEEPEDSEGWKKVVPMATTLGSLDMSKNNMKMMSELTDGEGVKGKAFIIHSNGKEGMERRYEVELGKNPSELTL